MKTSGDAYLYWRLGQLGVPFDQIGLLKVCAAKEAYHNPGKRTHSVDVPGTACRIVYDQGIDGWDGKFILVEPDEDAGERATTDG